VGVLRRTRSGRWRRLTVLVTAADINKAGFNRNWTTATNGELVLAVRDDTLIPPELVVYDLRTKRISAATDLNPQLHSIRYANVELIHWKTPRIPDSSGFLVKPLDYKPGARYPLLILQDDGVLGRSGTPYLLDASIQLSGYAIQTLAAHGFMVLYTREPPELGAALETPEEGGIVCEQMEAIVAKLDAEGLIDTHNIGISGWSRAGYYTNYLLIHSSIPFAAASTIDGGSAEYTDAMRAYSDEELHHIHTPLLFESHSLADLVWSGSLADRLVSMNSPTEILYFSTASHSTTRPQHRMRSLSTHLDWWRFWLQGYIDPSPDKRELYEQWTKYRKLQSRQR
jgi:dipeptidyl aminopeptidase/acylaminoacyl peptidase